MFNERNDNLIYLRSSISAIYNSMQNYHKNLSSNMIPYKAQIPLDISNKISTYHTYLYAGY